MIIKIQEDYKFYSDKIKDLQEKNDKLSNDLFLVQEENKNLVNKIQKNNLILKNKEDIIKFLTDKMQQISNEYK